MLSEIFQKQYDFEHQRRSEVTSAAGAPIVAVTVLSSALAVTLLDFPYARSALTISFFAVTTSALVGLAAAIYYIFRSIWNYRYERLPPAPALSSHLKALESWHVAQGCNSSLANANAVQDLREYVDERLSEAADWNGQNNDRRGNFLHMGTTAVAIALALFVPAALLYAYAKAVSPDKVYRIELTNQVAQPKETIVTTTPSTSGGTGTSPNTPASTPATTPNAPASSPTISQAKPLGPPNAVFRTNTELPSPQANIDLVKK